MLPDLNAQNAKQSTVLAAVYPAQPPLKQQRSGPPGHQGAYCQLMPQQTTGADLSHRQLQCIPPSVSPQDTGPCPPPFLSKRQSSPGAQSQTASRAPASSSPLTSASSAQTSIPAAKVEPQPPPLMSVPQHRLSFPQVQSCSPPPPPLPPPPLLLPRHAQNPPAALQRLSLHSVQALAIQSRQVVLREQEPCAREGLVQTPYQSLPPPQTVAVDLKVQPVPSSEAPLVSHGVLHLTFVKFSCLRSVLNCFKATCDFHYSLAKPAKGTVWAFPRRKTIILIFLLKLLHLFPARWNKMEEVTPSSK